MSELMELSSMELSPRRWWFASAFPFTREDSSRLKAAKRDLGSRGCRAGRLLDFACAISRAVTATREEDPLAGGPARRPRTHSAPCGKDVPDGDGGPVDTGMMMGRMVVVVVAVAASSHHSAAEVGCARRRGNRKAASCASLPRRGSPIRDRHHGRRRHKK